MACLQGLLGSARKPSAASPPHVAVLVWGFPPAVWGGVHRPAALCRHVDPLRTKLTVVTGPVPREISAAGRYLCEQLNETTRIQRVEASEIVHQSDFAHALPEVDGGFTCLMAHYRAAIRALSDPPGLVFASGPRFESFIVAYLVARRFNARLVLDYRDEWTECPFPFVTAGGFDRRWEHRCLRMADHVIFTTESQRRHQLAVFPALDPDRCSVIPNGWDPTDVPLQSGHAPCSSEMLDARRRIAFVGYLGDHTLPDSFFSCLQALLLRRPDIRKAIRFEFIGKKSARALELLRAFPCPDVLHLMDHLPKPEALEAMRGADALLVLNPPDFARYIPGKLYDYLAMRRPLLVFGCGGEIEVLVRSHRAGLVIDTQDPTALEQALGALVRGELATPLTSELWLAAHTREVLARQSWALMEKILARGGVTGRKP